MESNADKGGKGLSASAMLSESIIAEQLEEIPNWEIIDSKLYRRYKTRNWKSSMMLANMISHLAEVAWHHPDLDISFSSVVVKLTDHEAGGLSLKDFELAAKIEETILWRPALVEGALVGTPQDPRFAYLLLD